MFNLYDLIKTSKQTKTTDENGNDVLIPKGAEAHIVDIINGWYTVEFIDHEAGYPIVYDYRESEIEPIDK